jgi:hypothetical protein
MALARDQLLAQLPLSLQAQKRRFRPTEDRDALKFS